ncbi:prepilin-type N-terminal cleavage/methylation domain-containing protein [Prosthecobacter sp.]|uniref:prepilin-type N-terminal cleavage/methylation domain-containing protein n=1 Tax=Prosthecobacter sp. TaxID=1965333 RepID=UPI0037832A2F
MKRNAFTLLETLLALMVFSVAVVALVEAVNQLGKTTINMRREGEVRERLRSLLLENTRLPMPASLQRDTQRVEHGDVLYTIVREPLTGLKNRDGAELQGLHAVRVTAEWREGNATQQATAETWVFPPLFQPH